MATVIPSKGGFGRFMTDRVMKFFEECDDQAGDIISQDGPGGGDCVLREEHREERGNETGCRTTVEESPVGSHASNGIVERAVQTVGGQIRVMKFALDARLGIQVDAGANVVTFMAQYASFWLNHLELGKDGKTAHERAKGNSATVLDTSLEKNCCGRKRLSPRWTRSARVGSTGSSLECESAVASSGWPRRRASTRRGR